MCDSALKKICPGPDAPEGDGQFFTLARADNERQQRFFQPGTESIYALPLTTVDEPRRMVFSFRFSVFRSSSRSLAEN
jgi:hypothetical protein